jgi:predicted alpha/beta-hydrolase family hydrolase
MSAVACHEFEIEVSPGAGSVSALLETPPAPIAGYVFAHGAGAGMRHPFLAEIAALLHASGVATLRYQFPYMHAGGRRPDPPARLEQTVRAAVASARTQLPGVPLVAGGKSMGGRMTARACAGCCSWGSRCTRRGAGGRRAPRTCAT